MNTNMSDDGLRTLNGVQPNYNFINKPGINPVMMGILLFIILIYYFVLSDSMKKEAAISSTIQSKSSSMSALETMLWLIFISLLIMNGIRYFYDLDIKTSIKGIFTRTPEVDINIDQISDEQQKPEIPEIKYEKQVFHIPDNSYDFDDARAVCAAYGAKLATYDQIEKAYEAGGEWCGYGWSKDQLALYPTQKKTYDRLQKIKGHEHDCGRTGVNGGYIANPKVKFGVNCYGYKPVISPSEQELMNNERLYPKTKDDIKMEKRVHYWRKKLGEILVAPFNKTTWSKPLSLF
jgi:hypothetical protein